MKPFNPRRFELAVRVIAIHRAKQIVKDQIKARGEKFSAYSCRDITTKAEAYLMANREALIAKSIEDCWRFPEFARYRQSA